jgi:hypothetical protein
MMRMKANKRAVAVLLHQTEQELKHLHYLLGDTKHNTPVPLDVGRVKESLTDLRIKLVRTEMVLRTERD